MKKKVILISAIFISLFAIIKVDLRSVFASKEPIVICEDGAEYVTLSNKGTIGIFKNDVYRSSKDGLDYYGINKNNIVSKSNGACFKNISTASLYSRSFIEKGRVNILRKRLNNISMANIVDAISLYNCSSIINDKCDNSTQMGYIMNSVSNIIYEQIYGGKATRLTNNKQYNYKKDISNYTFNYPNVIFGDTSTNKFEVPINIVDLVVQGFKEMEKPTEKIDLGFQINVLKKDIVNETDMKFLIQITNGNENYDMSNIIKTQFIFGQMLVNNVKTIKSDKTEKQYEFIIPNIAVYNDCQYYDLVTAITKKNDILEYGGIYFGNIYKNNQRLIENITDEDIKKVTTGDIEGEIMTLITLGPATCNIINSNEFNNKSSNKNITVQDINSSAIASVGIGSDVTAEFKYADTPQGGTIATPSYYNCFISNNSIKRRYLANPAAYKGMYKSCCNQPQALSEMGIAVYNDLCRWISFPNTAGPTTTGPTTPVPTTPGPTTPGPTTPMPVTPPAVTIPSSGNCFDGTDSLKRKYFVNPTAYVGSYKSCCNHPNALSEMGTVVYNRLCKTFSEERCGVAGVSLECKDEPGLGYIYQAKEKGVTKNNLSCLLEGDAYEQHSSTYCTSSCKEDVDIFHQGWGYNPQTNFEIKAGQYFDFKPYVSGLLSKEELPTIEQTRNCVYKADTAKFTKDLFGNSVPLNGINDLITSRRYLNGGYYLVAYKLLEKIYELYYELYQHEIELEKVENTPCGSANVPSTNSSEQKSISNDIKKINYTAFNTLNETKTDIKKRYGSSLLAKEVRAESLPIPHPNLIWYSEYGTKNSDMNSACCCDYDPGPSDYYKFETDIIFACNLNVTVNDYITLFCASYKDKKIAGALWNYCASSRNSISDPVHNNTSQYEPWVQDGDRVESDHGLPDGTVVPNGEDGIIKYTIEKKKVPQKSRLIEGTNNKYECYGGYKAYPDREEYDTQVTCYKNIDQGYVYKYKRNCKCDGKKPPIKDPCEEVKKAKIKIILSFIEEIKIEIDKLIPQYENIVQLIEESIYKYNTCLKMEYGYDILDIPKVNDFYYAEKATKDSEYKEIIDSIHLEQVETPKIETTPLDFCEENPLSLDCGKTPLIRSIPIFKKTISSITSLGTSYSSYQSEHTINSAPITFYDIAKKTSSTNVSYKIDKELISVKPSGIITTPDSTRYSESISKNLYNYLGNALPVSINTMTSRYNYSFKISNLGKGGSLDSVFRDYNDGDTYTCNYFVYNELTPINEKTPYNKCFSGPESIRSRYELDPVTYHNLYKNECCSVENVDVIYEMGETTYNRVCKNLDNCFGNNPDSLKNLYSKNSIRYKKDYRDQCCPLPNARTEMTNAVYNAICPTVKDPNDTCFVGTTCLKKKYEQDPEEHAKEYSELCCLLPNADIEMGKATFENLCKRYIQCPPGEICSPKIPEIIIITCPPGGYCSVNLRLTAFTRRIDTLDINPSNRRLGSNWDNLVGSSAKVKIEKDNNDIYLFNPMYEFVLNSQVHRDILDDNKQNGYYKFDFICEADGLRCRSDFVKKYAKPESLVSRDRWEEFEKTYKQNN